MPDQSLIFIGLTFFLIVLLLLFFLVVYLLRMLSQNQRTTPETLLRLLADERVESQSLRNQLRSQDVQTLTSLNYATLPQQSHLSSDPLDITDLGEAINQETELAAAGYQIGDLGYDLESAGWNPPIVQRDTGRVFDAS